MEAPVQSQDALTRHGRDRARQRAIPQQLIEWLLAFGTVRYSEGAEIYFFDHKARDRLRRHVGEVLVRQLGKLLSIYVVLQDGRVITVGYRTRRVPNP